MDNFDEVAQKLQQVDQKEQNKVLQYKSDLTENDLGILEILENKKDIFEREEDFEIDENGNKSRKLSKSMTRIKELKKGS